MECPCQVTCVCAFVTDRPRGLGAFDSRKIKTGTLSTIGPGAYNLIQDQNGAPQYSFPHEKRFTKNQDSDSNNFYGLSLPDPNVVGESAPQYSFPKAHKHHAGDSAPELGPGTYYPQPSAVLNAAPAYSIGNSARVDPNAVQKKELPGPGAYPDTDLVRSHVQGGQFGRESRFGLAPVPEESLGPGEYDAEFDDLPEPKGPSFPKASRGHSVNSDINLGPGTYEHPDTFKSNIEKNKGFSLSAKLNPADPDPCLATPGPLDYKPAPVGAHWVRGGKFGKDDRASSSESRGSSKSPTPGPGRYTPQKERITPHAPEYSFGGASRSKPLNSDAKTATIYDIRATAGSELPAFSMGKRLNPASSATKIPGPGAYQPSALDKVRFPIAVFGKEEQRPSTASTSATRDMPAPGEYNPNLSLIKPSLPKIGFGKSAQRILPIQAANPSPMDYNIESEFTRNKQAKKGATLSSRFKTRSDVDETPGPGEYFQSSMNPIRPRPSSVRIGKEKRGFAVKSGTEVPGPGEYSSKPGIFELVKMQARQRPSGTNLTKEARFKAGNPFDASPGPGTYAIANSIGSGTAWVMGSKLTQKNPHGFTPGPLDYNSGLNWGRDSLAFSIGTSLRPGWNNKSALEPGPGKYDPATIRGGHEPDSTAIGFGLRPGRDDLSKRDTKHLAAVPGPGAYDSFSFVDEGLNKKKGATLSGPHKPLDPANGTPGPGEYYKELGWSDAPGFTKEERFLHSKLSMKESMMTPGPGEFDLPVTKGVSVTIPKSTFETKPTDEPGPGHYDAHNHPEGQPSSTKGTWAKDPRDKGLLPTTPGPGDYNSHLRLDHGNMGGSRFPGEPRSRTAKDEVPGPGTYYVRPEESGGISFPREVKKERDNGVPGPGKYEIKSMIADVPKYLLL